MPFYRKFIIGDNYFTAYGRNVPAASGVFFTETNWDVMPEIKYNTETPSFDDGVYISDTAEVQSREITLRFVAQFPDGNSVRGVRSVLRSAFQARFKGSISMVTMTQNELGVYVETYKEVLENVLFVSFPEWSAKEDTEAEGLIKFLVPYPWKKAYVDGVLQTGRVL